MANERLLALGPGRVDEPLVDSGSKPGKAVAMAKPAKASKAKAGAKKAKAKK